MVIFPDKLISICMVNAMLTDVLARGGMKVHRFVPSHRTGGVEMMVNSSMNSRGNGRPMFLTPVGIKTLFPIFENSLCGKELAVETQTFEQRKYLPFSLWPNLLNMFFSFLEKKNLFFILLHGNILA